MDKYIDISLSTDKPSQPARFNRLPDFCTTRLPKAQRSQVQHPNVGMTSQERTGFRMYSALQHFQVMTPEWVYIRVAIPLTIFVRVRLSQQSIVVFNRHFAYIHIRTSRYMAIHLPAGLYQTLLDNTNCELFYTSMRYGLLVYHAQRYPFLGPICTHWKQFPHRIRVFDLGPAMPDGTEIVAASADRPDALFKHIHTARA